MKTHIGLKGRYDLTLTDTVTGQVREFSFSNLILDSGLDMYGEGRSFNSCALGADTNEPVRNQATMNNVLGSTTTLQANGVGPSNTTEKPYYCSWFWQYRFPAGVATGNISQVGVGASLTSANVNLHRLFSLALIKDEDGKPVTITKREDEVLDVRYSLQLYIPTEDVIGKIKIGKDEYNTIVRVSSVGAWIARDPISFTTSNLGVFRGELGTVDQTPALSFSGGTAGFSQDSYQGGSFKRRFGFSWDLNRGNHADGIRCLRFSTSSNSNFFQVRYGRVEDDSTIPKTPDNVLTLNFEISWGRADASI